MLYLYALELCFTELGTVLNICIGVRIKANNEPVMFLLLLVFTDSVKALYRRAKAYAACWDYSNARKDFKLALEHDASLGGAVRKELRLLDEAEKLKDEEDKVTMKAVFERYSE